MVKTKEINHFHHGRLELSANALAQHQQRSKSSMVGFNFGGQTPKFARHFNKNAKFASNLHNVNFRMFRSGSTFLKFNRNVVFLNKNGTSSPIIGVNILNNVLNGHYVVGISGMYELSSDDSANSKDAVTSLAMLCWLKQIMAPVPT